MFGGRGNPRSPYTTGVGTGWNYLIDYATAMRLLRLVALTAVVVGMGGSAWVLVGQPMTSTAFTAASAAGVSQTPYATPRVVVHRCMDARISGGAVEPGCVPGGCPAAPTGDHLGDPYPTVLTVCLDPATPAPKGPR
jgi:hypothetical protein